MKIIVYFTMFLTLGIFCSFASEQNNDQDDVSFWENKFGKGLEILKTRTKEHKIIYYLYPGRNRESTIDTFLEYGKKYDSLDKIREDYQKYLGKIDDKFIIDASLYMKEKKKDNITVLPISKEELEFIKDTSQCSDKKKDS